MVKFIYFIKVNISIFYFYLKLFKFVKIPSQEIINLKMEQSPTKSIPIITIDKKFLSKNSEKEVEMIFHSLANPSITFISKYINKIM
jgi:hypothetical protein